ncbi:MAG: hypothetical protein JWO96_662 [Candidatus Saccharibacteria bacterium]|nr:hypothetical protein [Candidatus Saccharibacteria bacterium]
METAPKKSLLTLLEEQAVAARHAFDAPGLEVIRDEAERHMETLDPGSPEHESYMNLSVLCREFVNGINAREAAYMKEA